MSFLFRGDFTTFGGTFLPPRPQQVKGLKVITDDAALRQSAAWGSIMLRANLMGSFPADVFRKVGDINVPVPAPPIITNPSGGRMTSGEWMFSTQVDLDRVGNCYGIIREVDTLGKPRRIDLVQHQNVRVKVSKDDVVTYEIKGTSYSEDEIWHERQYTVPGLVMGLSPIAFAAWSLGLWGSAAEFAAEWFTNHGITPSGILRNKERTLQDNEADKVKQRFRIAVEGGDLFVTGKDWEYTTGPTADAGQLFIDQMDYSDVAVCRFFGVPADLVDVVTKGSSVTYANITQRNLQFLIMHLGPAVKRREDKLSTLLPAPRFVKLNTSSLLRMDPETTSRILTSEVAGKIKAPSEARALQNLPPFTAEQIAEFNDLGIIHQLPPAPLAPQIGGSK